MSSMTSNPVSQNSRGASAAKPSASPVGKFAPEQIAKRAYEIWESRGRPEGNAEQHWREAERQLQNGHTGRAGAKAVA